MGAKPRAAEVERNGAVGILKIHPVERMMKRSLEPDCEEFIEVHAAIAIGLEELRFDPSVRVIVVTGSQDDVFYVAPERAHYDVEKFRRRLEGIIAPEKMAESRPSEVRARYRKTGDYVEQLLFCEKPIIARVKGDVIGAGQSVMWGCDLIVAREDAVISDLHSGIGEVRDRQGTAIGFPWATTPGDGAMAFAQQNFSSYRYKEYQYLSRQLTARELADTHVINYAVPPAELDTRVDEIVRGLLARPQWVLAHIRKLLQKPIIEQWNLQMDLAWAFEHLDFVQHGLLGRFEMGWTPVPPDEIDLGDGSVGRPRVPYGDESGISE